MREVNDLLKRAPTDPRVYEAKAALLALRGDTSGAEQAVVDMKAALPENAAVYMRAGRFYLSQKKPELAVREFEKALEKAPGAIEPLDALVRIDASQKRFAAAERRLDSALADRPKDAALYVLLAQLQTWQGKGAAAEAALQKAMKLGARTTPVYLLLAENQSRDGKPEAAVETLQTAIKASPDDPRPRIVLSALLERRNDVDGAIAQLEAVLKRSPRSTLPANNLAYMLAERKTDRASLDRALELAKRFESSPEPLFADTLGWVYYKRGEYSAAVPVLQRVADAQPENPIYQYHLGMALMAAGDSGKAKNHLARALASKTDFPGRVEAEKARGGGT